MADQQIRFSNLTVDIVEGDQEVVYWFNGDVDEHFEQSTLPRVEKPAIILELENVRNFNSCGIREWIFLARDLAKLGQLQLRRCSVTIVDQINMVPDLLAGGEIQSFFAPYFCETEDCVGEVAKLVDMSRSHQEIKQGKAPEFSCEKCGEPLSFDALEESYFLFAEDVIKNVS